MSLVKTLIEEVSGWPQVTVHPHQFMAREFRYGSPQIGHVHLWGDVDVDIPFIRPLHAFLVQNRLVANHRWLPDSGWTTFHIGNKNDLKQALWLMRISYLESTYGCILIQSFI